MTIGNVYIEDGALSGLIVLFLMFAFFVAVGWFISKFAKGTIPRLLFTSVGILMMVDMFLPSFVVLMNPYFLFGLGLVLPHIRFFIKWLIKTYYDLKEATINTYYFVITIYFKIRKVVLWFYNTFQTIYAFFSGRKQNKQRKKQEYRREEGDYYKQEEKQSYDDFKQDGNYEERRRQREEQEETEVNTYGAEFDQFFSADYYIVLGVNKSDDYKTIKEKYRALVKRYHPDINDNSDKRYHVAMQKINEAYDC